MANGALMQLVAYGAQDVYLTGNPQITFFKVVYRRHTNFAIETIKQTLTGNNNFGGRGVCKLSRNGDLVSQVCLETTVTQDAGADRFNNRLGFNLIKDVELRIGGQKIDKQSGTWMLVWTNLTSTSNQAKLLDRLVGGDLSLANSGDDNDSLKTGHTLRGGMYPAGTYPAAAKRLCVPLQFSFCRNPGLALPLIALQYHDVEIVVNYETLSNCSTTAADSTSKLSLTSLWVDYIFLDTDERKKFAQNSHEYLIEQVQEQDDSVVAGSNSMRLEFNHPVKELIWVNRSSGGANNNDKFINFTETNTETAQVNGTGAQLIRPGNGSLLTNTVLKLNGQERFNQQSSSNVFNYAQTYNYHTGTPLRGVNVYSFALRPEDHQPSGTCNFSRIDNASLNVTAGKAGSLKVMAHSYNVLRIASGMGGLAYSN